MFGRIVGVLGNDRMEVFCEDGKHRIGRIRGNGRQKHQTRWGNARYLGDI